MFLINDKTKNGRTASESKLRMLAEKQDQQKGKSVNEKPLKIPLLRNAVWEGGIKNLEKKLQP